MIDCQLVDQGGGGVPSSSAGLSVCCLSHYSPLPCDRLQVAFDADERHTHIFFIETTVIVVWIMTRTRELPCCCVSVFRPGSLVWDYYSEPVGNGVQLQCQTKPPDKSHHSQSLVPKGSTTTSIMSMVAEEG